MSESHETIIVGGGMAGIACGLKLKEAGKSCTMISETIGGRTCYNKQLDMNFGAVFYMENYHHVKKILTHGPLLMKSYSQVMCHKSKSDFFSAISLRMLKNLPQLLKFKIFMKKFITHYEIYKKNCESISVKDALKKDSFIKSLYFKTAQQLIQELKISRAGDDLISQFVYGCTGTSVEGLNALDFCNCAQGLVMPIYTFSLDEDTLEKRLECVIKDSVTSIENRNNTYAIKTLAGKQYTAKNLVVATPAIITKTLLNLPEIRKSSQLISYLVKGQPRKKYRKHDIHIFSDTLPLIFYYHRQNDKNEYELFSVNEIDMGTYFDSYEIVAQKTWPDALYVKGDIVLDQDLGNGLYVAGDHNGLGMEPAAISGIFAANQIIKKGC